MDERGRAGNGWPAGHAYLPAQDGSGEMSPSMIWHLTDSEKFLALRRVTMRSRFAAPQGLPGRVRTPESVLGEGFTATMHLPAPRLLSATDAA